jgi:hypothetical protein
MITLAHECLVFQLAGGESVPFSPEMISIELMGETAQWFDPDFVHQAAKAVFHYFKKEQGRQTVTLGEFAEALEKVLRGFSAENPPKPPAPTSPAILESDLCLLARESGQGWELVFFPRLRAELQAHLRQSPKVLRFHGLRPCVKHLVGVQRWSNRCQSLEEQIVSYLRECLNAERQKPQFSLVVE